MNRKLGGILLGTIFVLLVIFSLKFTFFRKEYDPQEDETVRLLDACKPNQEFQQPKQKYTLITVPKETFTQYSNPFYYFAFSFPNDSWFVKENRLKEYEWQIAYPQMLYSLIFSTPAPSGNTTSWENGQKAVVEFLVFRSYCQSLASWQALLPEKDMLSKKDITISGVQAVELTNRINKSLAYILINGKDLHYEFYLQVKDKADFDKYFGILQRVVKTFTI